MFSCFGGKSMNKKDEEPKKKTSVSTDNRQTIVTVQRTRVVKEQRTVTSKITGNTFPRQGGSNERNSVSRLRSIFSTNDTARNPVQNPSNINLNYKSPYRTEKDVMPFSPGPAYTNRYEMRPLERRTQSFRVASTAPKEEKKVKIVVKKNKQRYDVDNKIPTYPTSGRFRGSLLLINNILFKQSKDRKGADVDEKNLKDLFDKLGFTIETKRNMTRNEMLNKLDKYTQMSELKRVDINLVIIMSHGQGDKTGVTKIFGVDDKGLAVCEVLDKFNECPHLLNKPKIFIFMCCRGDQEAAVETDTVMYAKPSKDMLLAYSTSPGFVSYRNPVRGTYYTQALCEIFMEHACDTHVEDLLKMVEQKLSNLVKAEAHMVQTSSYENRGFKLCYFHP